MKVRLNFFYFFENMIMKINKKRLFAGICVLALFFVFFVGRSFDATTGQRHLTITANGLSHFRK